MRFTKLIEGAWRVYRNRENSDRWKLRRTIATSTIAALTQQDQRGFKSPGSGTGGMRGHGQGGVGFRSELKANQCAYCKEFRHWKGECPQQR